MDTGVLTKVTLREGKTAISSVPKRLIIEIKSALFLDQLVAECADHFSIMHVGVELAGSAVHHHLLAIFEAILTLED